jgi:hypothetical protein
MCIRGKLHYDNDYGDPEKPECLRKGRGYYNDYTDYDAWQAIQITNERIRQIKSGEAVLRPNIVKLLRKAPKSTIASLYKYQAKLITQVRKAAKQEVEETSKAWKIIVDRKKDRSRVLTGHVDNLVNRIKDEVSVGATPITMLPEILEQFEITQGGTEGFVAHF